jgi:hypothetical protein
MGSNQWKLALFWARADHRMHAMEHGHHRDTVSRVKETKCEGTGLTRDDAVGKVIKIDIGNDDLSSMLPHTTHLPKATEVKKGKWTKMVVAIP